MLNKLFLILFLSLIAFPALAYAGEVSSAADLQSLPPQTSAASPISEKARYDHALGLYMQENLQAASDEFASYLKDFREGEHADDSLYWLGKCRELAGKFGEAEVLLRRAINDFPASDIAASIQFEIGYCLYSPKNPDRDLQQAFAEFMKVPSLYQSGSALPQALYYGAKCQLELKELARAKEILGRIVAEFPDSPYAAPALYNLGRMSLTAGNACDAEVSFKTLLSRYPAGLYSSEAAAGIKSAESAEKKKGLAAADSSQNVTTQNVTLK
jgi:TolA-binding protein